MAKAKNKNVWIILGLIVVVMMGMDSTKKEYLNAGPGFSDPCQYLEDTYCDENPGAEIYEAVLDGDTWCCMDAPEDTCEISWGSLWSEFDLWGTCSGGVSTSCSDSDGGQDKWEAGYTSGVNQYGVSYTEYDLCNGDDVYEAYCDGSSPEYTTLNCPSGYACDDDGDGAYCKEATCSETWIGDPWCYEYSPDAWRILRQYRQADCDVVSAIYDTCSSGEVCVEDGTAECVTSSSDCLDADPLNICKASGVDMTPEYEIDTSLDCPDHIPVCWVPAQDQTVCDIIESAGYHSCSQQTGGQCSGDDAYYCADGYVYVAYQGTTSYYFCAITGDYAPASFTSCPNGCENGECQEQECLPDGRWCEGNDYFRCDSDGFFMSGYPIDCAADDKVCVEDGAYASCQTGDTYYCHTDNGAACYWSDTYIEDSNCYSTEEECDYGREHFTKKCYGGDVYWYSTTDMRGEKADECGAGSCAGGVCQIDDDGDDVTPADDPCDGNCDGILNVCKQKSGGKYTYDGKNYDCVFNEFLMWGGIGLLVIVALGAMRKK